MTAAFTRRAIIIVTAADQPSANSLTAKVDTVGGNKTFAARLVSATDPTGPITHYWCGWNMTQAQWDALWGWFGDGTGHSWRMYDCAAWTPGDVLADMGLTVPPA